MDLSTVARIKTLLDLSVSTQDTILAKILTAASLKAAAYLGFPLGDALEVARTETYDVERGDELIFTRFWPIKASPAPAIKNAVDRDFASATAIDTDNYDVRLRDGRIAFDRISLIPGPGVLQIVYTAGLGATPSAAITAFPGIAEAVDLHAAFLYKRHAHLDETSFSMDGGTATFSSDFDLIPSARRILDDYRRHLGA